jgi:membrane protein required for beta-lactamase induction
MVRGIYLFLCAGGGVWLAWRGLQELAHRADRGAQVELLSGEAMLLVIPVLLIGAMMGAAFGGMLLPARR